MANSRQLNSTEAAIVLRDTYDLTYGIFDHEHDLSRPLALVGKHEREDTTEYGALYRVIYQFNTYEVNKNWGLNLSEFLELPREIGRLLLRISSENSERSLQPTKAQIDALKNKPR